MLTTIREKASGIVAWVIIILITIPFALWGINSYFSDINQIDVAVVNGTTIDQQEYKRVLSDRRRALLQQFKGQLDQKFFEAKGFKKGVLDSLIVRQLISQDIEDKNYRISDQQLAALLQQNQRFQVNGKFSQALYQSAVNQAGLSDVGYEQRLRRDAAVQQIQRGYTLSAFVPDQQLNTVLTLALEQRRADYVLFSPADYRAGAEVSDKEIQDYYELHKQSFQRPERLRVEYIELSIDSLATSEVPSDAELRSDYEARIQQYTTTGKRTASHILAAVEGKKDEAAWQQALQKAQKIEQELRAGADFAVLAKTESDDQGSAKSGGDLGVMTPGVMVKPFEEAVKKLQLNQISAPVKTQFGYHIIKLTSLVKDQVKPFSAVKNELIQAISRQRAENQFVDRAETFRNLVYEQSDTLQPAADALELKIKQSDWISRKGAGVAGNNPVTTNPKFVETAFSTDVQQDGLNSAAIEIGTDHLVALRKLDYEAATIQPLDKVRDQVVKRLVEEKARKLAIQAGKKALEKLQAGSEDWQALLDTSKLTAVTLPAQRHLAKLGQKTLVDKLFAMPVPAASAASYASMKVPGGGLYILHLDQVTAGDASKADAKLRKQYRDRLQQRTATGDFDAYLKALRARAEIKVFEGQL